MSKFFVVTSEYDARIAYCSEKSNRICFLADKYVGSVDSCVCSELLNLKEGI